MADRLSVKVNETPWCQITFMVNTLGLAFTSRSLLAQNNLESAMTGCWSSRNNVRIIPKLLSIQFSGTALPYSCEF